MLDWMSVVVERIPESAKGRSPRPAPIATSSRVDPGHVRSTSICKRGRLQFTQRAGSSIQTQHGEIDMRKLIVSEFVSLDGVMQAPGGRRGLRADASG